MSYYKSIEAVRAASALGQPRGNCCICGKKHNLPNITKGYVSQNKCKNSMINLDDSVKQFNGSFRRVFQEIAETIINKKPTEQKLYKLADANGVLVHIDYKKIQDRVSTNTELNSWWDSWWDMMSMPFIEPSAMMGEIESILDKTHDYNLALIRESRTVIEKLNSDDFWQAAMTIFNDLLKSQKYREAMGKVVMDEEKRGLCGFQEEYDLIILKYPVTPYSEWYIWNNFLYMQDAIGKAGLKPEDYTRYPSSSLRMRQYNVTDAGHDVSIHLPNKGCFIQYFCTFNGEISNLCVS